MWIAILALSGAALADALLIYCCMIVSGREDDAARLMQSDNLTQMNRDDVRMSAK